MPKKAGLSRLPSGTETTFVLTLCATRCHLSVRSLAMPRSGPDNGPHGGGGGGSAAVPIPAVASASVLHSAAVGGSVVDVVRLL